MVVVSITLPTDLLKKFDDAVQKRGYFSRSEAFRDALRSLISELEPLEASGEKAVATIMVTSEQPRKDITVKLTGMACEFDDVVMENLHRRIGDKYSLTVFVAQGSTQRIRDLIGRIRGMRGIQQVKTVLMPM